MDSFYGGKQGVSFVIKASFNSIKEMVDSFKKNEDKVWFGEYCLIDTINKNDKDNGKIFRRGIASSTNSAYGGGEYIGQIVGPSSGTPLFQFDTLDNVLNHKNEEVYNRIEGDIRVYPTQVTSNGEITQYNYRKDENGQYSDQDFVKKEDGSIEYVNNIKTLSYAISNNGLVSGKDQDDIKWTWCNVKKANKNSESWFYVGFQIPYLVNEFTSESVYPYDNKGNYKDTTLIISNPEDSNRPFYQRYTLQIPKGIKGDSLNGIKVITLNEDYIPNEQHVANKKIYNWDQFVVDNKGRTSLNTEEIADGVIVPVSPGYTKNLTTDAIGRQILVYEYRINDRSANGETYLVYVGDFNIVEKINLSQDGTLKIYYTHDGIPEIIEDKKTGKFIHTQEEKLKWIQSIEFSAGNGDITLVYNTKDKNGDNEREILNTAKLRNITNASINNKGNLNFGFNTTTNGVNDFITVKDSNNKDFIFKGVQNISLLSGLDVDKHLTVTYTTKTKDKQNFDKELIGSPINSIYSTAIDESNFHLLILFEDKDHRYDGEASIQSPHIITKDEANNNQYLKEESVWVRKTISGENPKLGTDITYWWLDLGSVKDDAGVLIGLNVTQKMINDSAASNKTILGYLDYTYPNGLISNQQGKSLIGKIATYGDVNSSKKFYAFDYNYEGTDSEGNIIHGRWYYLGEIAANDQREIKAYSYTENITNIVSNDNKLTEEGGIALYYKSISENFGSLPSYWK